ncbi:hypothetical protein [Streptomyces sp. bgisy154]|uniref:hypothetical protein n=1 Tax=Streptomyces sp. bgisy154 TaxID=3413794 RepID=UPI003D75B69A
MSTDIVKHQPLNASLPDMVRYAEHLANANLLPGQYRKQPANVLYAMEYGRTLGITPLAAITGIHVIEGKPSASAALISGLVRQAGHKLRVRVENGQGGPRAIATIHRADDPDFEFRAEWDMQRAQAAGLVNKDVWRKYPQAMLKARAITEVARDACEEVLFGLHYTPEELDANVGEDGVPMDAAVQHLRRVPSGETDPWATPAQPQQTAAQGRDYLHEAREATDVDTVRRLWQEAKADGAVPEYLDQIAAVGQEKATGPAAAAPAEDDVPDAEVVAEGETEDDIAERELRAAAAKAGLDNLDEEFERSYGLPISQAGAPQMREMTAILTGRAA